MLQPVGRDAKGERLHRGDGGVPCVAIRESPGDLRDLGDPATVFLDLDLDPQHVHGARQCVTDKRAIPAEGPFAWKSAKRVLHIQKEEAPEDDSQAAHDDFEFLHDG